jgi:MscS family membrane protein
VSRLLGSLEQMVLILGIAWMVPRILESGEEIARNHALRRGRTTLLPLLPVPWKSAKIFIATFAGLAVLHKVGVNVITVLAGLGIGGIAVALAAQKTVENFINLLVRLFSGVNTPWSLIEWPNAMHWQVTLEASQISSRGLRRKPYQP